jgi:protocadherin Fat 1/2/3
VGQVAEDAAAGTVVVKLGVRDGDAAGAGAGAGALSFFVADGDARARFQLRSTGELYVARALDRELEPEYQLSIAATDGKFTAYTSVRVTVLDVDGQYRPSLSRVITTNWICD